VRQVVQLVVRLAVCSTTCCGLLLWTCCWLSICSGFVVQLVVTACCTTNQQQIEVMESDMHLTATKVDGTRPKFSAQVSGTRKSSETCVQVAHTRHKKLVPETWRLQFRRFTSTANDAFTRVKYASFF